MKLVRYDAQTGALEIASAYSGAVVLALASGVTPALAKELAAAIRHAEADAAAASRLTCLAAAQRLVRELREPPRRPAPDPEPAPPLPGAKRQASQHLLAGRCWHCRQQLLLLEDGTNYWVECRGADLVCTETGPVRTSRRAALEGYNARYASQIKTPLDCSQ